MTDEFTTTRKLYIPAHSLQVSQLAALIKDVDPMTKVSVSYNPMAGDDPRETPMLRLEVEL